MTHNGPAHCYPAETRAQKREESREAGGRHSARGEVLRTVDGPLLEMGACSALSRVSVLFPGLGLGQNIHPPKALPFPFGSW